MKRLIIILAILIGMFCVASSGEMQLAEKPNTPFKLRLDQQIALTDDRGVIIPKAIIGLSPSETVKITLVDGTVIIGLVKSTEMFNNKIFKVFGDVTNGENAGFGFGMSDNGVFGGAIVYRNTETVYKVEYSETLKGYIFVANKLESKPI